MSAAAPVPALQRVLALEHAAVYVLAALGAQTSRTASPSLFAAVREAYAAHRSRRDHLAAAVRDLGADPVAAAPAYGLPEELGTGADPVRVVRRRAREIEDEAGAAYAWLVGETTGADRAWAVAALTDAAVRGLGLGARPEPLPGLTDDAAAPSPGASPSPSPAPPAG